MLRVTLASGQTHDVQFDQASTLSVTNQVFVDGVATPAQQSWSEISDLELVTDPVAPQAEIPVESPLPPPAPTSGLPVDTTVTGPEPTSGDPGDAGATITVLPDGTQISGTGTSGVSATTSVTDPLGEISTGTAPVDPGTGLPVVEDTDAPLVEPAPEAEPPSTENPQVDALEEPQSVGEALAAADAASEEPVTTAGTQEDHDAAVAAAGAVVDAAVVDPVAHVDHLAQAQADLKIALDKWPESEELQDLKTQLDDLAADAAEASQS